MIKRQSILILTAVAATALLAAQKHHHEPALQIPSSIAAEHQELHKTMESALKEPGALGRSAQALEKVLAPHFAREEAFALPPLSALQPIAEGRAVKNRVEMIRLSKAIRSEYKLMLKEHQRIVAVLDQFVLEARRARMQHYAAFGEQLKLHALNEEQVLYPAAILVGLFLEQQGAKRP